MSRVFAFLGLALTPVPFLLYVYGSSPFFLPFFNLSVLRSIERQMTDVAGRRIRAKCSFTVKT